MGGLRVGQAANQSGWSARMLRYLEQGGLVVPERSGAGYRRYGIQELNRLRSLRELRDRFGVELNDLAFAARLRSDPALGAAVHTWLAAGELSPLEWEQRKHERLLAA